MRRSLRLLPLVGSGIGFALAFPKGYLWPLAFVGLIPLLLTLRRDDEPTPALAGFAWGAGFFGLLLSWLYSFLRHYGQLGPLMSFALLAVLVCYLAVYPGLFAHCGSLLLRRHGAVAWFLLPPLWVTLEWIRGRALTGFPWGLAGYCLARCLPLIQVAAWTGVYGVTFLILSANVLGAAWIQRRPGEERKLVALGTAVSLLYVALLAVGARELHKRSRGAPVLIGLVQASVPQDQKWSAEAARGILSEHERLTSEAAEQGARLILWPESSSPFPLSFPVTGSSATRVRPNWEYRRRLEVLSTRLNVSLLFGAVDYRETDSGVRPVNAAALVRPDRSWGTTYAKAHLVPFGEYVPLANILPFVSRLARGAIGDFLPGSRPVLAEAAGLQLGTSICYEIIFPELVRQFPLRGARVLANLTNDAWFGTSAGPYQHFDMAVLRAVENRRYLIRAANTGISGIVEPSGRVLSRTGLGESRALVGAVYPTARKSVYTRLGDVFAIVCAILTAAALAAGLSGKWRRVEEASGGSK